MAGNNSSAGMDVNGGKICRSVNIIAVKSNDTQRPSAFPETYTS